MNTVVQVVKSCYVASVSVSQIIIGDIIYYIFRLRENKAPSQ